MKAHSTNDSPGLWRLADVARFLAVSTRTAERMASAGQLPGMAKLGTMRRWRAQVVMDWVSDGCPPAAKWEAERAADGKAGVKLRLA